MHLFSAVLLLVVLAFTSNASEEEEYMGEGPICHMGGHSADLERRICIRLPEGGRTCWKVWQPQFLRVRKAMQKKSGRPIVIENAKKERAGPLVVRFVSYVKDIANGLQLDRIKEGLTKMFGKLFSLNE
ncbi:unnamed protein product [Calicophoron daubneyi]|uniref:Uncharacterized protein n=1 Tax=Calicophoron daubneyi TaxID=300641 RepID=A0AAV2T9R8_CALDB